ncbi:1-phosphofructokinase [Aurantiacibacter atlanticus]|uniref:Phosphofructokinase n=1 Tax=Aurantiacibacter atlanticus TaxID=1648404 RepID=A0A0H4VET9_9SPHN|nr:1-phosphofructokinase family hexose kinase [Aurantiacibacter atlanticus]AKQ41624.2 1-phosphofructokinase [Aurantiacibacter atlanticus]
MIATLTLNPAIDGSAQAEKVVPVHKIRTAEEQYYPGGGGINVARVIKELGGRAFALYLGGGATGSILQDLLRQTGVRAERFAIPGLTRISHTIYERSTALEFRFVPEGPEVTERDCGALLQALRTLDCEYLVASGSIPRGLRTDIYAMIGAICRQQGIKLVLDSSGEALRQGLAGGVHLAKPSLGELETLVGQELPSPEAQEAAARELMYEDGIELLALTRGAGGAMLMTGERTFQRAAPKIKAKSAVGSGDSFLAAMTLRLAAGDTPETAFLYGMAAGAATALTPGTALCERGDVERLYAELQRDKGTEV